MDRASAVSRVLFQVLVLNLIVALAKIGLGLVTGAVSVLSDGLHSLTDGASNVVALGKRYSDRLYFSFEQAIGATTEYLVKLDYALTRRVSLRGQTGTSSGVGLFYRYAWD